jgi:hypothetical protein
MTSTDDKLLEIFRLREEFMQAIVKKIPGYYPQWPIDVSKKQSQVILRDSVLRGVEEMFEALQHLKNSKPHRQTEVTHFERDEFLEEIVDAYNYFLTTLVLIGISPDELYEAYRKKHEKILERLENGY